MAEVSLIVPGRRHCPTIRWDQYSAKTKTTCPQPISISTSAETKTPDFYNLKIETESFRSDSVPVKFKFHIQYSILKFNIQIQ